MNPPQAIGLGAVDVAMLLVAYRIKHDNVKQKHIVVGMDMVVGLAMVVGLDMVVGLAMVASATPVSKTQLTLELLAERTSPVFGTALEDHVLTPVLLVAVLGPVFVCLALTFDDVRAMPQFHRTIINCIKVRRQHTLQRPIPSSHHVMAL